ncbi:hypothetical protein MKW98_025901 [Papaver atlanticum]|uniref:Uncharacterized protein n=1 Tax=Papaver atlanticum TaxID=357466 RepID=A0AAD4SYG8_9MAGN|nr:hypothetical protein MKW98_025901 [Papaver atlanticum]
MQSKVGICSISLTGASFFSDNAVNILQVFSELFKVSKDERDKSVVLVSRNFQAKTLHMLSTKKTVIPLFDAH